MMKKAKTIGAMLLAAAMLFGTAACSGNLGKDEDPTKTYLDVGVFDAGLGTTYFDEMKKDFEAYYANESFEEGKMGVVVRPLKKKYGFQSAEPSELDEKSRSSVVFS